MSEKHGLVLGGGGSKGSYEVGVCMALKELGYSFDIVTGTSIGALIGALVVQDDIEPLVRWVSNLRQSSLSENLFMYPNQYATKEFRRHDFNHFLELFMKNGPDISNLKNDYLKMFDFEKFKNSPVEFGCLAYDLNKNELTAFNKREMTKEDHVNKLFASTAYFPAYEFVKVGQDYYADGGYVQTLPFELCSSMGANDMIVVDLEEIDKEAQPIPMPHTRLRPLMKLHSALDFEAADLVPQMREGYLETLKYLNKAPGYLYTFFPEDWKTMQRVEKVCMTMLMREGQMNLLTGYNEAMKMVYQFILHYEPLPLENEFSQEYLAGRLIEVLGLICRIPIERQYHYKDFLRLILAHFNHFEEDPNKADRTVRYDQMELKGVQDYIVFFHSALEYFHGKLPEGFDILKKNFTPCYYIAQAWRVMESAKVLLEL